jgi:hypothetical protein
MADPSRFIGSYAWNERMQKKNPYAYFGHSWSYFDNSKSMISYRYYIYLESAILTVSTKTLCFRSKTTSYLP